MSCWLLHKKSSDNSSLSNIWKFIYYIVFWSFNLNENSSLNMGSLQSFISFVVYFYPLNSIFRYASVLSKRLDYSFLAFNIFRVSSPETKLVFSSFNLMSFNFSSSTDISSRSTLYISTDLSSISEISSSTGLSSFSDLSSLFYF